jgi:hypothetical protein
MFKKLIMAGIAIAVFFVAPVASASPVLTENAVTVPVGALVIATSTETPTFTGAFNVVCSKGVLTGTVTKNSSTKIEGTVAVGKATYTGTGTGGDCTSALGPVRVTVTSELCVASGSNDTLSITGCGGQPVQFTLHLTDPNVQCKYSTAAVSGTFTTNATPATARVVEQEANRVEGGFICPSSGKLDQDFDLYRDNEAETPLTIS